MITTDLPAIPQCRLPPWRHQLEAFWTAYDSRGFLLSMWMGTGKTRVAIDLVVNRGHKLTLVLCPKSVIPVWSQQFERHGPPGFPVLLLENGGVAAKAAAVEEFAICLQTRGVPGVLVVNYESAWRKPLSTVLQKLAWGKQLDCLVMDEIHRIKSPPGKASQFCWRLSQVVPYRLGLTGTPMPHSPLDIFAQYRALDASIFGSNYFAFRSRYAILGGYEGRQVVAYKNEADLNQQFRSIAYQAGPEVIELPEALHHEIPCRLEPQAWRVYQQLERELRADVEKGEVTVANALVKLLRLQQITSGYVPVDGGALEYLDHAKIDALADLLEDLGDVEPVVIFCRFRHDLANIEALALGERGYYEISGEHNDLDLWRQSAGGILGVQIQSGGLGIDLTHARYCAYYSLGFSLGDYEQSQARVHRPGQEHTVHYYHLICERTVDEYVYHRLRQRKQVVEGILNMWKWKETNNGQAQ